MFCKKKKNGIDGQIRPQGITKSEGQAPTCHFDLPLACARGSEQSSGTGESTSPFLAVRPQAVYLTSRFSYC